MIQLTLTLKMTTAQVVEMSVTVNNNCPLQDYVQSPSTTTVLFRTTFTRTIKLSSALIKEPGTGYVLKNTNKVVG